MESINTKFNDVGKVNESQPSTSGLRNGSSAGQTWSETELLTRNKLTAKRTKPITASERQEIDELVRKAENLCIFAKEEQDTAEANLIIQIQNAVAAILQIAKESKAINGISRRALKVAASSIMDAGAALVIRTLSFDAVSETEVTELQSQLADFGNSLQRSLTPPSMISNPNPEQPTVVDWADTPDDGTVPNIDVGVFEYSEWVDLRIWRMLGISKEQVIAAVAKKGGFPKELVICSDIIPYGKQGMEMDSVFVTLPEVVAKKVAEGQELMIGIISVLVKILPPKPVRCSMCMEAGHNRSDCTSDVDCSGQCFRCSREGHKAVDCTLPPSCILCQEVGKPSNHSIGDRACTAPSEIKYNR